MKEKIILIGGGGHCRSCIDVIEQGNKFHIAGIVDMNPKIGQTVLGYKIVACDDELHNLAKEYKYFLITVGQIKKPGIRIRLFEELKTYGIKMPIIISPHAYVSRHASIGEGSIIMHHSLVNAGARIGQNSIINTKSLIEHDAVIGDHCHIATGALINGGAKVDDGVFIGSNVVIREYINIGKKSVIGANTAIFYDVPDGKLFQ
tara:strand:+ start:882 stop:1493 length:612 start_codon:yes stop_codon:yes gene_type:complete